MSGKKLFSVILCALFVALLTISAFPEEGGVHECSGAGFWFPGDPDALRKAVDDYMKEAPEPEIDQKPLALISPHAGYRFAGPVMGAAYKTLKGHEYKNVIILAFSHSFGGHDKISVLPVEWYETPVGSVPVNTEMAKKLLENEDLFTSIPRIHQREHSDENQLPFLRSVLEDFQMVSLFVGQLDEKSMQKAAEILADYAGPDTLFLASTDLTHYGTAYGYSPYKGSKGQNLVEQIHALDNEALYYMSNLDPVGFKRFLSETGATVCGKKPVELLLRILKKTGDVKGKVLHYYTSADKDGDHERQTCGYGAVAFDSDKSSGVSSGKEEKQFKGDGKFKDREPDPPILSESEQETLLKIARDTLEGVTKNKNYRPEVSNYEITENLKQKARVFVTLKRDDNLRGCIGHLESRMPIYQAVIANTYNAALRDPRFLSVKPDEVSELNIEISVNSPPRLVKDLEDIEVGKHGLIMEKKPKKGILLPQVPVEQGWNRRQFLSGICRKARLPDGSWKDPEVKLYRYSSQVFGEKE